MSASRKKRNVSAAACKSGAEIPAHLAGTDHRNTHVNPHFIFGRILRQFRRFDRLIEPHPLLGSSRQNGTGATAISAIVQPREMKRFRYGIKSYGAQGRNRTTDTAIFSRMLYQLSYLGTSSRGGLGAAVYSQGRRPCPPRFAFGYAWRSHAAKRVRHSPKGARPA
jgi:hypothetical protein